VARSRSKLFVIQKHDASTLHYDFRLQVGNVLRSWAVPKGPSTNPRDKRLAMAVEDHSLGYARFEGVIESGYGDGTVIVWDIGTYENVTEHDGRRVPIARALKDGHAVVELHGEKLQGGYALTRVGGGGSARERWILVGTRDDAADARRNPVSTQPESVLTGRRIEEVRASEAD
jgi:DNA ligase D-like protein (predicted 3'-phosphoesterase)